VSDPFGLRALDLDAVRTRPGVKWQHCGAALAAWVADMDFPIAPAIREALVQLATTDVGYPHWTGPRGRPSPAADAFAERMEERYAWTPRADRIHELDDVVQGVRVAVHHLTQPGDGIVLHTPAYYPFLHTLTDMRRRLVRVPWPFDHDELDARLAHESARLLILCHPQNPTGHVFGRAELERIAEIALRHDLVVVSDEIHADLVHDPHVHVPFESLGDEVSARTVTVTSPSKAFNLAGLRWAALHAGNDALQVALDALPDHYLGSPNVMGVAATVAAWRQSAAWLDDVRAVLDENRHRLVELLATHLPAVRYTPPDATYLAWLDCRALGLGGDPAQTFLARGVELSSGPRFGEEGRGHARLNFATSPPILEQIVRAMAA
jgi:cysteine-S-conjugate beta-lyase